jgi:hypothetical protein
LKQKGIRIIGFYCPYKGDRTKWLGCDPTDFYDVPPQCGTMQDWRDMVAAAHSKGMKVICYFVNIYIDIQSAYFKTAEQQYAAGNLSARECSSFHWTKNNKDPVPGPGMNLAWQQSSTAGAYYFSTWGMAGFDFNLQSSLDEVTRFEKFWLDAGMDGFMFDVGMTDQRYKYHMVDLPKTYTTSDKWLTFEVTSSSQASSYVGFGLTSWFNFEDNDNSNDYTYITKEGGNANGLETRLANVDYARSHGCMTHNWSVLTSGDGLMYVQEAALLAGAGVLYGSPMSSIHNTFAADVRTAWGKVLQIINNNPSLWPISARKRIPAGSDTKAYAMMRTSTDGSKVTLLAYNFSNAAKNVTVDLTGTGISTNVTPYDLYKNADAPRITSTNYTVNLPAWGFAILDVTPATTTEAYRMVRVQDKPMLSVYSNSSTITFMLSPGAMRLSPTLTVVDMAGKTVCRLNTPSAAGNDGYVTWSKTTGNGHRVKGGYYVILVESGSCSVLSKKILVD